VEKIKNPGTSFIQTLLERWSQAEGARP